MNGICLLVVTVCLFSGLVEVPKSIPTDTKLLDLQNNRITEIKENDFKGLSNLYVSTETCEIKNQLKTKNERPIKNQKLKHTNTKQG